MGEQLMTITLNGSDLTVTQVVAAARHGEAVILAPEAIAAMRQARAVVQDVLATGEPVYGLTTGVGERKAYLLDPAERQRFNQRLVRDHRIAQADVAPADVVGPLAAALDFLRIALAPVAAIEFVVAAQAIDLRALGPDGGGQLGLGTGRAYRMIRELVPFTHADGTLPADLEPLVELVTRGTLTPAA
jgi:histidine ammonia-lyase